MSDCTPGGRGKGEGGGGGGGGREKIMESD